jgi:hypothetical protein
MTKGSFSLSAAVAALAGACALILSPAAAHAAFTTFYKAELHGGVAVDGVALMSTPTSFASGSIQLSLPTSPQIQAAFLYVNYKDADGIAGYNPSMNGMVTLDGASFNLTTATPVSDAGWAGLYRFDVTSQIATKLSGFAGGAVSFAVTERGDMTTACGTETEIDGITLIVVWRHPSAPSRVVSIAQGVNGSDETSTISLAAPFDHNIAEPAVLSVDFIHETGGEQENASYVNGVLVGPSAGGADDGVDSCSWSALFTIGSFGAPASPTKPYSG